MRLALAILLLVATPSYAKRDTYAVMDRVHWEVRKLRLVDCKSQVYESVRRLERLGIKADYVPVQIETGEFHAIAVVDGEWALDGRYEGLKTLAELRHDGYRISPLADHPPTSQTATAPH